MCVAKNPKCVQKTFSVSEVGENETATSRLSQDSSGYTDAWSLTHIDIQGD
jgi:hypothetical protein